ncbi:MAG: hypothetical protein JNL19_14925 [Burkholderiales bacterium]|nr:hypothetical protein [Burkholderiales bacterium]
MLLSTSGRLTRDDRYGCLALFVHRQGRVLVTALGLACAPSALLAASDPALPDAPTVATVYRSAFTGYRRWQDSPVQPWLVSNAATARAGGWRAYAREATRESASDAGVAPALAPPMSPPGQPSAQPRAKGSSHAHH